ncbi:MAG: bifunctional DNA-formamidopyrimidine glycosylase/DNA-(apurinic or apyrimidinic site) lyase [Rhodocyclaceae bacterium]|nr:bifunctional DNA-formamidopyrimidine glycosylase/DNA-(apurinic or apyrimidinic site) lyase [Rhodocyclaceae bacterium]
MPELPEVETTRRGIAPWVEGRVVSAVHVRQPRLRRPVPAELAGLLVGTRVRAVQRRAKYLVFDFGQGQLLVHLGMSGSLRWVALNEVPGAHDHVDLVFGDRALRYRDPRRFGMVLWQPLEAGEHPLLAGLGPEPLSDAFNAAWLLACTRGVRTPVKVALMDARKVVGVGNIYASESLFRAGIDPRTPAGALGPRRIARLVGCVRQTLAEAIEAGGSSLRDFVGSDGKPGYFQQQYFVYGREGEDCRRCGGGVRKLVQAQRSTYFCPRCQRR